MSEIAKVTKPHVWSIVTQDRQVSGWNWLAYRVLRQKYSRSAVFDSRNTFRVKRYMMFKTHEKNSFPKKTKSLKSHISRTIVPSVLGVEPIDSLGSI